MENLDSLKKKSINGLLWSFLDLVANQGIQFIIQIVLARLLLPEHFGIIGMIIVFIALSTSIVDSGFSQALIRDQNTSQEDYSTVFHFNLFMAIAMYFVLFILANPISSFYGEPQLINIIRVLSIVLVINSFGMIQRTILIKNVDFKTITKTSVIAALISGSITIIMAFLGFGIWSLIVNIILLQFIQTLLLWFFNRWIPSLTFKMQSFKKYFKFGYKLLLSGLLDTFYNNLFFVIIGRVHSTVQLGYYANAVKFSDASAQSISAVVQRVSYPVLSSIQGDEKQLKSGFRKIIKTAAFINFPLMIGLAAVATPLFSILLGDKWLPSVIYFQLLCFAGMLYPIHAINLNILQVKGRSDLFLLIEIIKCFILTILIGLSLLFELGIIGLVVAAVLNSYISLFINIYFSSREIAYSAFEQIKDILPVFILSIVMGIIVNLVEYILPGNQFIRMLAQISIGVVLYIVGCRLAKIQELVTIYHLLQSLYLRIKLFLFKNKKVDEEENNEKGIGRTG